jgi:hypothetical protein
MEKDTEEIMRLMKEIDEKWAKKRGKIGTSENASETQKLLELDKELEKRIAAWHSKRGIRKM